MIREYDRLTALDASFLYAESPVAHMHVGSLAIFEDAGFTEDELREHIAGRLHQVPRFRKRLARVPYGAGRPVWVDDPHFDLRFHIRYTGLPKPAEMPQALRLMGRVMSLPLDRRRPLWEMWVFDLPEGKKGIIQKTHHCLIDGISGVDLGTVILDFSPKPVRSKRPLPDWKPEAPPDRWELLRDTLIERVTQPRELLQSLGQLGQQGLELKNKASEVLRGTVALGKAGLVDLAPKTSLNVAIGPHRRFEVVPTDLERIKVIKNGFESKVNDVVLAVVTGGLREIFLSRGDSVEGLVLKAMVPVSVRDESQRMTYGNQVSMMTADLPVGEADPIRRLELIRNHMAGIKESKQAVGADFWVKLAEFAPPTVLALAGRAVAFQRMVNLAITNVPGPQFPLYLLGGKLLDAFPYVPLIENTATGVAVLSYNGRLDFGISGDYDAVPDLHVFAEGVEKSVEELERAASG